MIKRAYNLQKLIKKGKVLIIYGARQVGKTTLINEFLSTTKLKYRFDTGDNYQIAEELSQCTYDSTDNHVGRNELIVIDEAQKIPNIGNALKLMVDRFPNVYFIVTGSSSFELANSTGESLTGRKRTITLFPISQQELELDLSRSQLKFNIEKYLVFGSYPEVINAKYDIEKKAAINSIANSYLIKDILEFDRIRSSDKIYKLLKLVAFQIGSELSANELSDSLDIDTKTVLNYLDLLEKSFVIFTLTGYSKNLRKEITKKNKYYFYDLGVRNSLISNFNKIKDREDIGGLWENFLIVERMKRNNYKSHDTNYYFWRTYDQKEVDFVEENSGRIFGYEFKWGNRKSIPPLLWKQTYKNSSYDVINSDNYLKFIL